MRVRLSLRSLMLAIALLSPLLYGVVVVQRAGGLAAFRKYHGRRELALISKMGLHEQAIRDLQKHAGPGHSCAACRSLARPVPELIAYKRKILRELKRAAWWHGILAHPLRREPTEPPRITT